MADDGLTLDTLRAELANMELRLVDRLTAALDKKADHVVVEALEARVVGLELTRAERAHLSRDISELMTRTTRLERFRNAVPTAAVLSLLVAISTALLVYLGKGG